MAHHHELSNLLPHSKVRAFRRSYRIRLGVVLITVLTVLVVIHGILLLPAYLYSHSLVSQMSSQLADMTKKEGTVKSSETDTRIRSLQADITYLGSHTNQASGSGILRAIVSVPHPGIRLNGFTYTQASGKPNSAQMTISGTASTRDSLRQYVLSLGNLSYVDNADLPISAYAKESDIPFTITLTGTLKP